jgi:hypothetical protein
MCLHYAKKGFTHHVVLICPADKDGPTVCCALWLDRHALHRVNYIQRSHNRNMFLPWCEFRQIRERGKKLVYLPHHIVLVRPAGKDGPTIRRALWLRDTRSTASMLYTILQRHVFYIMQTKTCTHHVVLVRPADKDGPS